MNRQSAWLCTGLYIQVLLSDQISSESLFLCFRTEPSRLQSLSLQLADKISQLVENNERLLEHRPGGKLVFYHLNINFFKCISECP